MISRKLIALLSATALLGASPAFAQAKAPAQPARAAASLSPSNALGGGEDGVGWAMAGLVFVAVAYVLVSILVDDDDDDDDDNPVSP